MYRRIEKIWGGQPGAKATLWSVTDAEARTRGGQTGLDTLVVHAVNDESYGLGGFRPLVLQLTH